MKLSMKLHTGDMRVILRGADALNPDERAKKFANMARQEINLVSRLNNAVVGHNVPYETFVDGVKSNDLRQVKETSRIVTEWEIKISVVEYIHDLLSRVGPIKSGRYRQSMVMFADGVRIEDPKRAANANTVLFVSTVPYARKIERGEKGYSPGAVYEAAAAMAKGRFSNIAQIRFTYAEPPTRDTMLDEWAMQNAFLNESHEKKRAARYAKNRRNPAIIVYL